MSDKRELLPCPFCGGKAKVSSFPGAHNVWCENQPVSCGNRAMFTIEQWNTRAATPEDVRAVVDELVNLQHMAVAENGVLRWMSGRKMQECELYALPGGGAIRDNLYRHPQRPVVMPERIIGQQHGDHIAEAQQYGWNACLDEFARRNPQ
jgi:hypothetical protein